MNNRRQTIWLVSMLSLMVILSAYYLFTEDAPSATKTAEQQMTDSSQTDTGGVQVFPADGSGDDGAASGTTDEDAAASPDGSATNDAAATDKTTDDAAAGDTDDGSSISPDDEAVLEQLNNQTGRAYFDNIQLQRDDEFSKLEEELNAIIGNTSKHTQEEAAQAQTKLNQLYDTEERISSLESKLHDEFDNAVVEEENNTFKVVVQADKLDKVQAVSIVETAMKELNVGPGQVSVQYVANP